MITPVTDAVVVVQTEDGPRYQRVCDLHRWAGLTAQHSADVSMPLTGGCPLCAAEQDMARGRARYAALPQTRIRVET